MALPTSTTNGATATINGIVYTYNSTKGAWYKQSTASTNVPVTISGTLSVSGNANVGNLGSPTVVNGNSNVTVTANGNITFTSTSNSTMVVSSTGANITGTANISGNANVGNLGAATAIITTGNITTVNSGLVQNGTSNLSIVGGGNISASVGGTANVAVWTTTGVVLANANVTGYANIGGNANVGNIGTAGILSVTGNANVGNLGTGAVVATANITNSARYVKTSTGGLAGGAAANITRYGSITTSSIGDIHISSSTNGNATVALGYGLTFSPAGGSTQAGIIVSENGTDGTGIGFFAANSYATGPQLRLSIEPTGNILPGSNVAQNLGSATLRWSTVYTGDLELSNGIGDYTIVEGEDDLFLYNNRSGKTYRFMLQEVDPAIVPPKKGT